MLDVQRPSERGDLWRGQSFALPRALTSFFHDHNLITAVACSAFIWILLSQLVEARYLLIAFVLHAAVLLAGGTVLTAYASRTRRENDAETAGVAHDLRGPLVSLQATLELLADDGFGALPEQARAAALRAAATSSRAAEVVERTLRHATHDRATTPLGATADLDVVLRETLGALDVQVRTSGATVEVGAMLQVAGDSSALFRVFVNLVQNGLKYHQPYAAPHIVVTSERDGMWVIVSVAENGIGIAPSERWRVFERHYRTAAGSEHAGGDGLGLATVSRLITAMGGTVWVDDSARQGTTIRMRLPLA